MSEAILPFKRTQVLSVRNAAASLSISESTIRRLIADSKIKTIRLSERRTGIPVEEVERIAAERIAA